MMRVIVHGRTGTVNSWSQYGSALNIRVEFDAPDERGFRVRENLDPCEVFPIAPKATP